MFFLLEIVSLLLKIGPRSRLALFDPAAEGLLVVETIDKHEENPASHYYVLADGLRATHTDAIEPDSATIYEVPLDCIESYIDRNKVLNRLNYIAVTDEDGNPLPAPAIMEKIFPEIAKLEHDCLTTRIFEIAGEYFVYAELNVNLWCPCALYYYHQETGKLLELYTFSEESIRQIQILSRERLQKLR